MAFVEVSNTQLVVSVTPTITAGAYTSGFQLGDVKELVNAVQLSKQTSFLTKILVIDKAAQSAAINFWFFKASPTIASSEHAAFDLTDANLAAAYAGHVQVYASDYITSSSNAVACKECGLPLLSTAGTGSLWVVAQVAGTPTYAATSDLTFSFTFLQD